MEASSPAITTVEDEAPGKYHYLQTKCVVNPFVLSIPRVSEGQQEMGSQMLSLWRKETETNAQGCFISSVNF